MGRYASQVFADEVLVNRIMAQRRSMALAIGEACEMMGSPGPHILDTGKAVGIFAGETSPLTQVTAVRDGADLSAMPDFYRGRTTVWEATISPFARTDVVHQLIGMGGKLQHYENVTYRTLSNLPAKPEADIREMNSAQERELWGKVANQGFFGDLKNEMTEQLGFVMATMPNTIRYMAFVDGEPAGTASSFQSDGCVGFGGGAVLPQFRGKGLHAAMIAHRLNNAPSDCDLAILEATPGSTSQRNAERLGFRVAFTLLNFAVTTI